MVKGTSRQVIVVHATEEKLFDQAIFLLREGAGPFPTITYSADRRSLPLPQPTGGR